MDTHPVTAAMQDFGCSRCQTVASLFWLVELYFLPSRLVRKRHRIKERASLYCDACYEASGYMLLGAPERSICVPKPVKKPDSRAGIICPLCQRRVNIGAIYGIISTLHMAGESMRESFPLATICSDCAEQDTIRMVMADETMKAQWKTKQEEKALS